MAEKILYGWMNENKEESHAYLVPAVLTILKKYGVNSVLDIGTGNGSTLPNWISLGINTSAMEPDPEGFRFASKHEKADVRQIAVGDILPTEWKNLFDAVICLEVVEHLYDPYQLIDTINYSLKNEGIAIISTPYHGYLKNLLLALAGKWDFHHHPLRTGGHIKFWSKKTLTKLFHESSYQLEFFYGAGRLPFVWKSMILVFKKTISI